MPKKSSNTHEHSEYGRAQARLTRPAKRGTINPIVLFGITLALLFFAGNLFMVQAVAEAASGSGAGHVLAALPEHLRPKNLPRLSGLNSDTAADAASQARFLIGDVITFLLSIAGIIAIYSIVNNAWWIVAAMGKSESIDQHKKGLYWAVGGLALILLSYIIIRFIIELSVGVGQEPLDAGPSTTPSVGNEAP